MKVTDTLPDGTILDLDSYDWGEYKLNKKQKLFVVWYSTPNQEGFKNPTKAAQKAGYSAKSSYHAKYDLIRDNPTIQKLIEKFSTDCIKTNLKNAADFFIQQKINQANYDISDFYETKEIEISGRDGEERTITVPAAAKELKDIKPELRKMIRNVRVNNNGVVTYELPEKDKLQNEIIKLSDERNKETVSGDFDMETTVNIVKESVADIKTTIKINQRIQENAQNFIEDNENQPEYD